MTATAARSGNNAGMRWLLALLAGTLVAAATASAAPAVGGPTQLLVIQVRSVDAGGSAEDKPPKGLSKGDRRLGRSRLFNVRQQFGKPAGALVGRDQALVTLSSARAGRVAGVATLPGGTIRFGGPIHLGAVESIPVTGGTGRYTKARGTLFIGDGDTPLNTYHLRLPSKGGGTTV
jgi:hypothetical protein